MGRRGHTTAAEIAKIERISSILDLRFRGFTFREIGRLHGVSLQAVHKAFWKVMRAHPYDDRARLRRQRALLSDDA